MCLSFEYWFRVSFATQGVIHRKAERILHSSSSIMISLNMLCQCYQTIQFVEVDDVNFIEVAILGGLPIE